jgi:hypothetical protein
MPYGSPQTQASLIDILDKVLDKGLVVAGDIRVSLANVELLTIKVRLLVCSVDKATEIGLDWWRHDSFLSGAVEREVATLQKRLATLERRLADGDGRGAGLLERRKRGAARPAGAKARTAKRK